MPYFGDRRIMACTPADMERWLREFTGDDTVRFARGPDGGELTIDAGGWPLTVGVVELPPRVVALLRMQQLDVRFSYPDDKAGAARDWIARFDQHTQRGGG
jgi:hypothetical protein